MYSVVRWSVTFGSGCSLQQKPSSMMSLPVTVLRPKAHVQLRMKRGSVVTFGGVPLLLSIR